MPKISDLLPASPTIALTGTVFAFGLGTTALGAVACANAFETKDGSVAQDIHSNRALILLAGIGASLFSVCAARIMKLAEVVRDRQPGTGVKEPETVGSMEAGLAHVDADGEVNKKSAEMVERAADSARGVAGGPPKEERQRVEASMLDATEQTRQADAAREQQARQAQQMSLTLDAGGRAGAEGRPLNLTFGGVAGEISDVLPAAQRTQFTPPPVLDGLRM